MGGEAAELVPAAAVEAEVGVREVVGCCVEGHRFSVWWFVFGGAAGGGVAGGRFWWGWGRGGLFCVEIEVR